MSATCDQLLDDFAIRSFRDIADDDYIVARMAYRAELIVQYLWASQQAVEKYLKCILLLKGMRHDLSKGLALISTSGELTLGLSKTTEEFIVYLNDLGRDRYLTVSNYAFSHDLLKLDRAVWELRRFCTLGQAPRQSVLRDGKPAPKVDLAGGRLEQIIGNLQNPAREPLLWQNCFFGRRVRRSARLSFWIKATNAPLCLSPQILDEVVKFVDIPKSVEKAYRSEKAE